MFERDTTRVNYGLLLGTVVFVLMAVVGILFLHSRQQVASTERLEEQTYRLLEEENYFEAFSSLNILAKLKPDDTRVKLELARCVDEIAQGNAGLQNSIRLNMGALAICQSEASLEPQIPTIRRRLVTRLSQLGNHEDAIDQISRLVGPEVDLELQRFYTISKVRLWLDGRGYDMAAGTSASLPNWFASLVGMPPVDLLVKTHVEIPEDFEIAGLLVDLCLGDPAKLAGSFLAGDSRETLKARAQSIVERLVINRPNDPFSWLLRYEISSRDTKFGLSEEDIERAVRLGSDAPNVLLVAGKLYLERAKRVTGVSNRPLRQQYLSRALDLFESSRKLNPGDMELYLNVGEIYELTGEPTKAIETWVDGKRVCVEGVSQLDFRIANILVSLNRLSEAKDALESMDQSVTSELAVLNRFEQSASIRQGRECWARYHLAMGEFQLATKVLQDVLATGNELDVVNQAATYMALGDCYRQIGQYDRAASAYEQAILLSPNNRDYRRRAASAWFSTGRLTEAYKQFLLVEPKEAGDWLQVCDVVLEIQRQTGQDSNYWFTFDKGMAEAKRLLVLNPDSVQDPWRLEVMQLDANVLRAAETVRTSAVQSAGDQLWEIVVRENFASDPLQSAIVRWKAWDQKIYLDRVSETLRQQPIDGSSVIEKAELFSILGDQAQAKQLLESKLKEQPDSEPIQNAMKRFELSGLPFDQAIDVIRGLKQGGWFAARRLAWSILKRPEVLTASEIRDPQLRSKRIERRLYELQTLEELLREFEGPEGTEWRYIKGRRLLASTNDPEQLNSIELLDLAGFLDRKRSEWPETHLLAGMIAESQGNRARAIREYNYAIQYGNSDIDTYERLVNLLYQQGLISDARVAIDRLGNRAYASRSLSAVSLQLTADRQQDQLSVAELGTQIRPNDPMAWVWLAQVTELHSRNAAEALRLQAIQKAESFFEKASEVAKKDDLRVEMARFNFYLATQNQAGQQSVLEQIQGSQQFDPGVQLVAIGQIHESLGRIDQAIESYRKAISLGGNDLDLRTRISLLMVQDGRLENAIENLQETLKNHPQDASTRRRLATLLANRSLDEDWQQVAQLLSPSDRSNSPEDIRLQVVLLCQKNDLSNLQKAQSLLERLIELPSVRTDDDYFQLASLYMRTARILESTPGRELEVSQMLEAAGRMLKIVSSAASPKPEYIYTYADFLIRQKRFFDAVEESQKLDTLVPGTFPAVLLRARISKIEGNTELAKTTVLAWLGEKRQLEGANANPSKLAGFLVQAGQALQILDEVQEGQKLLKEAYALDARAGVNYVRSILLTDDTATRNNAIRFLMDRLKSEGASESALLLSLLVRTGDTDSELTASAQKQLVDYSVSQKDDRKILQSLADLWIWRGNESQAIETFRRIVQDRPNDVVALNNLAMLLADSPNGSQEALTLINRAIGLVGVKPAIMDTKAYVLLRGGDYPEAIKILKALLANSDRPSVRFHLYQAYAKNKQEQEAQETLATIDRVELQKQPLTPTDQRELAALVDSSR